MEKEYNPTEDEIQSQLNKSGKEMREFLAETDDPRFKRAKKREAEETLKKAEEQMSPTAKRMPPTDIIPPKTKIYGPSISSMVANAKAGEKQLRLRERTLGDDVAEWQAQNSDYELEVLDYVVDVKTEGEAENLPIPFLDYLISKATKADMEEDMKHFLWSVLRNLKTIVVKTTSGKITLSLWDLEKNLIHIYFSNKPPFDFTKVN